MDFDSIISLLLILLFFIFPILLKRLSQRKKTDGPSLSGKTETGKGKKLSLLERLGEQIREYVQTLEQEAQKGRQSREAQENIWDHLAEEGDVETTYADPFEQEVYADEPVHEPSVTAAAQVIPEKKVRRSVSRPGKKVPACDPSPAGIFRKHKLSSHQLQQAIIWLEILSKPVALRRD